MLYHTIPYHVIHVPGLEELPRELLADVEDEPRGHRGRERREAHRLEAVQAHVAAVVEGPCVDMQQDEAEGGEEHQDLRKGLYIRYITR